MGSWFWGFVFKLSPSLGAFSRNQWARNEEGKITNWKRQSYLVVVDGLDELVLELVDGERLALLQDGHVGLPPEGALRAGDDVLLPLGHVRARGTHLPNRAGVAAYQVGDWC